jgi:polysaccharide biosynthesis transport protein
MHPTENGFQPEDSDSHGTGPEISITDSLWTLRRAWYIPVAGCLIGLTLGISYAVMVPTPYKASARILIDRGLNRYLQTNKIVDEPTFDDAEIATQVYILTSDSSIAPVVRSMNLTSDIEFVGRPSAANSQSPGDIDKLARVAKPVGTADGADVTTTDEALERIAVESVMKRLTVSREDTAVINISFESLDAHKAASITNAIADVYIANTAETNLKATKVVSQWLQDRLTQLQKQVTDADRALQDYKIANNLVSTGHGSLTSDELANLNSQLGNARAAVAEAKARLGQIRQARPEALMNMALADGATNPDGRSTDRRGTVALNNDAIARLRAEYRELASKEAEIESLVGPTHLAVLKYRQRMEEVRGAIREEEQRMVDTYASEYQLATTKEKELAATVAKSLGEVEIGNQAEVAERELASSAETLRALYNSFLQKFKEINTIQTETVPLQSARIISRATPPLHKSFKKPAMVLGGSVALGFLLSAGTLLAREWAAGVFRRPKDVERLTGLYCVILPKVKAKRQQKSVLGTKQIPIEEYVLDAPYSRFTETLRDIKASINNGHDARGAKVIGIVSSVSKEGKTTIAANLAALMIVSTGARALVIDADLHMRSLTAKLAPDAREGLIEALQNPSRLAAVISERSRSGLHVLPCPTASRVPNAAELLGSAKMEKLMLAARNDYDYIIVEIAPIMSVVDLKMIERFIDGFIFVAEWGHTKRRVVLEALSEADFISERLMGIVLNKADPAALRSIELYKGGRYHDYYQD